MNMYKSTSNTVSMYNSSGKELDLRTELDRTFNGASDEIRKGRIGLLRKMRRDEDGEPVRCPCRDNQTDEPDRDSHCYICKGMGFLWDERKILYYKNESSFLDGKGYKFYIQYDQEITDIDYIVKIKTNKEGEPTSPIEREKLYKISKAHDYKSDKGRLEYWETLAIEERKWSVHYDVKLRTC